MDLWGFGLLSREEELSKVVKKMKVEGDGDGDGDGDGMMFDVSSL